jgi:tetratricopeptide (TPR) repeat protein
MRRRRQQENLLGVVWLAMLTVIFGLMILGLGSIRYDGLDGLFERVRVEAVSQINSLRPHPEFAPTPLPAATVDAGIFASQLQAATATPSSGTNQAFALPSYQPALPAVELTGFTHMWQTWNNCGPATLATNLSFFNHYLDQAEVAAVLKPNRDDKNVSPEEMVAYAQSQGFQARVFINGNEERLKLLLSNYIPILIETWLDPEDEGGLGHYRLLIGYDDAARQWIASDSYVGTGVDPNGQYRGIRISYDALDPLWAVFNRAHVVVYNDQMAPLVQAIIGEDMSQAIMWHNSLARFQREIQERPNDPFVWFNLGSTLMAMGQYQQAATAYDQARAIGLPWRMLWYQFGPFQAYYETGRYDELIALADATINTSGGQVEELYYWKGMALAAKQDIASAQQAWEKALSLKPSYTKAAVAMSEANNE